MAFPVSAQSLDRLAETRSNVAYFYHARPGVATVQVSVWGTVPQPGIYEVPLDTDLEKLLTMAGGVPAGPREEGEEIKITVRLFRQTGDVRSLLYEAPVEELLVGTARYPDLQDDDMVVLETVVERGFSWRDAFTIIGSAATVALAVERIISLAR